MNIISTEWNISLRQAISSRPNATSSPTTQIYPVTVHCVSTQQINCLTSLFSLNNSGYGSPQEVLAVLTFRLAYNKKLSCCRGMMQYLVSYEILVKYSKL